MSGNGPFALFKWEALFRDWRIFAEGFGVTLAYSFLALILAIILGVLFGVMGSTHNKLARAANRVYVEFIQNTPLPLQMFFLINLVLYKVGMEYEFSRNILFGLESIHPALPVFIAGVIGIGVYHGAYMAEVVRSGIGAVPRGQLEAAYSQGFSYWGAMWHVILPQAKRLAFPPMTNVSVNLVKNTSVMAMVAGADLLYRADSWSSEYLYYGPSYVITGLLYLAICYPLATYARSLERKTEAAHGQ
ncbi:MAG: amino acid ABC transporter permease [Campylobacteraceae bacterium]|nr:amino acid ABC transporter permease [Campylobacteraceae bacterium]